MDKNRKLTLEQRITRLEKLLKLNRGTRKFEQSYETSDFTAAEVKRFCKALNMRSDISVIKCAANPDVDSWFVVIADSDGDNETDFGIYKYADGHIEAWRDDRSRYSTSYNSVEECAEDIGPYDTSLWGDEYY